MHNASLRILLFALTTTLLATAASAQDERVRLSVGTAATTGSGDNVALTASVGYRFLERLSFEVDFTATESSGGPFVQPLAAIGGRDDGRGGGMRGGTRGGMIVRGGPGAPGMPTGRMPGQFTGIAIFPPLPAARRESDIALVTAGFRYELPVQGGRLRPYVGGGLGLARTDEEFALALARPGGDGLRRPDSIVRTGVAAAAGAGASLRVFKGLFVDVDARYFRLDRDRDLTRLGGGLSYRF